MSKCQFRRYPYECDSNVLPTMTLCSNHATREAIRIAMRDLAKRADEAEREVQELYKVAKAYMKQATESTYIHLYNVIQKHDIRAMRTE